MTLEGKPPVRRDTIFRLASMTKPITAVAAMMLIEEGKLKLDEPIDLLAPELADHRVLKRIDGPLDDTVPATRGLDSRVHRFFAITLSRPCPAKGMDARDKPVHDNLMRLAQVENARRSVPATQVRAVRGIGK